MGGQVDEEFDGTFPVVTYENATVIYKGYLIVNTCYYRLKWKQRTYTANFYYPEYGRRFPKQGVKVGGNDLRSVSPRVYSQNG